MSIHFLDWKSSGRRDRSEFEMLLRPHLAHLYRTALRLTGHVQDAEDLVQDFLVRLYPKLSVLRTVEILGPWLKRALYNLFVDRRRIHDRSPFSRLHEADADTLLEALEAVDSDPAQIFDRQDLQQMIFEALGTLSAEHRAVLVLHDMEGHTLNELSSMLELPLGTLKSRLFRARQRLKPLLERGNLSQSGDVLLGEGIEHERM